MYKRQKYSLPDLPSEVPPTSVIAWNSSDLALAVQPLHCLNLHTIGFWRCYLSSLHNLIIVPSSGVKAPFGSFSTSLSFRIMIWIVRCSLRTYLSYPLSSSTLHAVSELVQDEKDFIYLHTVHKRGRFIWSYWVNIDVSLKEEKAFSINLPFPPFKVTNTPDFSVSSCLISL